LLDLLQKDGISSVAWDSVADIASLNIKNVSSSPEVYILANNHPKNREFFAEQIKVSLHKTIYLVDPWRLVSEHELAELRGHRLVHYFSLSHLERDLV
jgi:hypothetical protein